MIRYNSRTKGTFLLMHLSLFLAVTVLMCSCLEGDDPLSSAAPWPEQQSTVQEIRSRAEVDNLINLIEFDLEQGVLTEIEALELLAYNYFAPEKLPVRYQFDPQEYLKCLTPLILNVYHNWTLLSPEAQSAFRAALARPDNQFHFDSPGGYFRIHYDTTGNHSVYEPDSDTNGDGVPDYVNSVAESADICWIEETTSGGSLGLDYDPPANDGTAGGGNNLYDIYLRHSGAYGYTAPDGSAAAQYPGRNALKSYIVIDPTYQGFGYSDRTMPMKVTVAHEFFHAIQFIYNSQSSAWFWESGATWMEDKIYDDVNDYYQYLRSRFKEPYTPLHAFGGLIPYGSCIWNHFLEQYHNDTTIIRYIWESAITNSNIHTAAENVLSGMYGTTLRDDFQLYTQWNYICGKNDDGNHYEEGADWATYLRENEVWISHEYQPDSYPIENDEPAVTPPESMGSVYIRFYIDSGRPGFRITFDGQDSIVWGTSIILAYTDNTYSEQVIELSDTDEFTYENEELTNVDAVILVAQNMLLSGSIVGRFHYSAEYIASLAPPTGLTLHSTVYNTFSGAQQFVYLEWNSNTEAHLAGYNVYRSLQSGSGYQRINSSMLSTTHYLDKNLDPAVVYYYIIKAVDTDGYESSASNEVHS